ncbi:hypothetical protein FGB62_460g00 [Gracilaria domingensis]|nr:hypothetical protein FGB62_460g00 [Gracilaria domingensis]
MWARVALGNRIDWSTHRSTTPRQSGPGFSPKERRGSRSRESDLGGFFLHQELVQRTRRLAGATNVQAGDNCTGRRCSTSRSGGRPAGNSCEISPGSSTIKASAKSLRRHVTRAGSA